jgi:hypothetical protein
LAVLTSASWAVRVMASPASGDSGPRLAADLEAHRGAVPPLMVRAELGQPGRQRQRLAAQRVHRPARLGQPVGGHPVRLVQQVHGSRHVILVGQHGAGDLDLHAERAE